MTTPEQNDLTTLISLIDNDDASGISAFVGSLGSKTVLEALVQDDEHKRTPVMYAYWYGRLKAAAALVRCGASYQSSDMHGKNVTWYAKNFGRGQIEIDMATKITTATTRISMTETIAKSSGDLLDKKISGKRRIFEDGGI